MTSAEDISSILISEEAVINKLPSILIDAILLDHDFTIIGISENVLGFLEYSAREVENKNINFLSGNKDLASQLRADLAAGFFESKRVRLFSKQKQRISVSISGFYLGLISHMNGYIIIKIKNIDEVELLTQKLLQNKAELDNFIYRTSHDLRGPLATIRGLINLIKIRKDNIELDMIVPLLDEHANKLDERLSYLAYLAHSDRDSESPKNIVDFQVIEGTLRKFIEQNAHVDFIQFHYSAPDEPLHGVNELLLTSFLMNLLMHTLALPMSHYKNQIFFCLLLEDNQLKISLGVVGFTVNEITKNTLHHDDFVYTDIVKHPHLINFYAAQKIASRLNAQMAFHFISEAKHRISAMLRLAPEEPFANY